MSECTFPRAGVERVLRISSLTSVVQDEDAISHIDLVHLAQTGPNPLASNPPCSANICNVAFKRS